MSFEAVFLRITEIFYSLQGESQKVGLPTVFIRLTGCPLRCTYCDTSYAFQGGQRLSFETIFKTIQTFKTPHICITGGEPLAQPNCFKLLTALADKDYAVSLETSGAINIENVDPRTMIIMDLKTPGSQESQKNRLENLLFLKKTDQIKFVLCHRDDYDWAVSLIKQYDLENRAEILFSPAEGLLNMTTLAEWILKDKLPVRFQLQLHKILWNDAKGH